jgi:AraC-like DNA-binding protein
MISENSSERLKYNPSGIRQYFPDITIRLHCCHYWMIKEWEWVNLASPFWRLYHNTIGNASVSFKDTVTQLNEGQILIIPPNTPFSTRLKGDADSTKERHNRRKINSTSEIEEYKNSGMSDHFFIHFNLGLPFDLIEPGIHVFPVTEKEEKLLDEVKQYCINNESEFDFTVCAAINGLILCLLDEIPRHFWNTLKLDKRIAEAVTFIWNHLDQRITNKTLSDKANMVENSFARLFKENIGISVQQYIKKKRIDKAVLLLHHSDVSIEKVAFECGFSDRHHFSRTFKELMSTPPVFYRKQLML